MAAKSRSRPLKAEQPPAARAAPQPHTAAAGYLQDHTALGLAAWAYRPGMPKEAHSNEAQAKSDALARKDPAATQAFAPGLRRLNMAVHRASDPDDTANDLSLMPGFNAANRHYEDSHMQSHAPNQQPDQQKGGPTGKPRGFQIHKVQAAAQAAKGNQYTGPDDDGAD